MGIYSLVGEFVGKMEAAYKALKGSTLKWLWKFNMPQNCQEGLLKHTLLDLISTVSDSMSLCLDPKIYIFDKFPDEAKNSWSRSYALRPVL